MSNYLCFGTFAKQIKRATSQNDEDVVYDLLGAIIQPLGLLNKNGQPYIFDKKEISEYLGLKLNIPVQIIKSADLVKDSVGTYFRDRILPKVTARTPAQLLSDICSIVRNDVTILSPEKSSFITMATESNLHNFLGEVFLYAVKVRNNFNAKIATGKDALSLPLPSNTETYLLAEVGMNCPLCGKSLMQTKGKVAVPDYKITYIYPLITTPEQEAILDTITFPSYGLDDIENKIALCDNCNSYYIAGFSAELYNALLAVKAEASNNYQAQTLIDKVELDANLVTIVKKLIVSSQSGDLGVSLSLRALKVAKKMLPAETLLKNKIENYVVISFNRINEIFRQEARINSFDFDTLAQEIKYGYNKLLKRGLSQSEVFAKMTVWVQKQTAVKDLTACEAVVSFFVQNCEVFYEITE